MGEYLSNKLNVFWSKMSEECERFVRIESNDKCLKILRKKL